MRPTTAAVGRAAVLARRRWTAARTATVVVAVLLGSACTGGGPAAHPAPRAPRAVPPLCTPAAAGDPSALVVRGCVALADGTPTSAVVFVAHQAGLGESLAVAAAGILSAGICFADDTCKAPEHPRLTARTDAAGRFRLTIPPHADAASSGSDDIVVVMRQQGLVAMTGFRVRPGRTHDVVIRPMLAWRPDFTAAVRDHAVRTHVNPFPRAPELSHTFALDDTPETVLGESTQADAAIDADLLPPGQHRILAKFNIDNVVYETAGVRVASSTTPISFRTSCKISTPQGQMRRSTELDGCDATDGDWSQEALDPIWLCGDAFATRSCLDTSWALQLDLRRTRAISDVVVAGAHGATVTISVDGRHWTSTVVLPLSLATVQATGRQWGPQTARYVRVTSDDLAALTEVAVFGPG